MIRNHDKLTAKTAENQDLTIEVNYSEDPEVKDCKMLRFDCPNLVFHVKREELVSILLMLGDSETQKKLIPVKRTNVKKLERRLHFTFKAQKDYRAGEVIEVVAPWIDEVPTEEEMFAGNLNNRKIKKL